MQLNRNFLQELYNIVVLNFFFKNVHYYAFVNGICKKGNGDWGEKKG